MSEETETTETVPVELKEILPELCWALRLIVEAVPLALERLQQGGVPVLKQREFWNALLEWEDQYNHFIVRKGQTLPRCVADGGLEEVTERIEELSDAAMERFPELSVRL